MRIYKQGSCTSAFGDRATAIIPDQFMTTERKLLTERLGLAALVTMHQVHGNAGICIENRGQADQIIERYNAGDRGPESDFLITGTYGVGLAIATADCLPVVLYDPVCQVIAAVHAGWRGTAAEIVVCALQAMHERFGSEPRNIQAFFGPSIGSCCYSVAGDFGVDFSTRPWGASAFSERNGQKYFDLVSANKAQLVLQGVEPESIMSEAWRCTSCSRADCSYRRDAKSPLRQLTIVALG